MDKVNKEDLKVFWEKKEDIKIKKIDMQNSSKVDLIHIVLFISFLMKRQESLTGPLHIK